ncbi:Response regulator of the LytR/AlgR family [Slackia heliotrinireducens]|uniref:Response regulator of the LytR/AlgR family n=1 Tax=Slackia heliotrinireducens (strain ATCC 29202 / DSM 20476 / NCTC 11029 / RHS 1) TaxID=471855 RepID=C7N5J7_SLAHD|nr:LytTR family DNA-binding domain-containing protein [Slackia heliotrinireducens]ACV22182.1 response regulator of the LytR/AlgR family [Slackia heliotrinireducens DSM 20476]VEH00266.1 Response regulator of the LytR/AlgR family [Slackia heliotrinireducens]
MPLVWHTHAKQPSQPTANPAEQAVQASRELLHVLHPDAPAAIDALACRVTKTEADTVQVSCSPFDPDATTEGPDAFHTICWRVREDASLHLESVQSGTIPSGETDLRPDVAGERRRSQLPLQASDAQGTTHWLTPDEIVFVEADHQYTNVHCRMGSIRLRSSFGDVVKQLDNVVLKVHRSYAVNPAYVRRLEREILYLTTGDKLPVPSKRVRQVRRDLLEWSRQMGSRQ